MISELCSCHPAKLHPLHADSPEKVFKTYPQRQKERMVADMRWSLLTLANTWHRYQNVASAASTRHRVNDINNDTYSGERGCSDGFQKG